MDTTRIKVKTIGYYHRDRDMKVTLDLLPKELNENKKYIDNPQLDVPFVNLNIEVPDSGAGESRMESLLEYIRQRPWTNQNKPDFVTNKNLLKKITASDYESIEVHVVRMSGVIFMIKSTGNRDIKPDFGAVFEHFLTGNLDDEKIEKDGIVRKAVFAARIPMDSDDDGRSYKVLYSGEIDAIDNNQHYELRITSQGLNFYFWKNNSCWSYWQAIFCNSPTIIIGSRTGKYPNDAKTREPRNYPEYSLYQIRSLEIEDIPSEVIRTANHPKNYLYEGEPYPRKLDWTVQDCEKTLQEFLKLVNETIKKDGDCFVFSKTSEDKRWIITDDEEKTAEFRDLVIKSLN